VTANSAPSLCLFSSHFPAGEIPNYIRTYLVELSRHSSRIVFVSTCATLPADSAEFLSVNKIGFLSVPNEGYDFGMWSKAFEQFPPLPSERVILANDSCILLHNLDDCLDQISRKKWDYAGLLASAEISYHLQSYFLVLSSAAVAPFVTYLQKNGIKTGMKEVIHTYEVGLTSYMQEAGLTTGAVFGTGLGEKKVNPVYADIALLIEKGFPLIKRKMLFDTFRLSERKSLLRTGVKTGSGYYMRLLKAAERKKAGLVNVHELKEDRQRYFNPLNIALHNLYICLFGILRKLK
jgi:lipopolysaccharide biosynthesis protein